MISLPAKWLKRLNLGKGDEIDVDEEGSRLVISKKGAKLGKETEINLTRQTETGIRTLITNAYRSGFDVVNVKFENEEQVEVVRNVIKNYLLGYDITKMGKNTCVVANITEPSPAQFDTLMHKIFFNIKELMRITKERLEGNNVFANYNETTLRIHQYDSFCRRVVAKRQKEVKDAGLFWTFQTLIVHGQRDLYHLNMFLDKNNAKVSKETLALLDKLSEIFELLMNGYLKKDTALLEKVHEMHQSLIYKKAYSILSKKKGDECIIIHHLMDSIRNFYLASSPLMGLLL
jgi:bifunctional DNA-binding transcriptional regulator/antitoxin component of YhaV-PrlF toxin-antitoxin module